MIVTRLFGGLGNQMFQYAFGLALAKRFGVPLYFDLRFFRENRDPDSVTPRSFSLGCFSLSGNEWQGENNRLFFPNGTLWSRIFHQWRRRTGNYALLYERSRGFDNSMMDRAKANSYLVGYWQSPEYFSGISGILKAEFQFTSLLASGYEDEIMNCANPVAIHVRRGDYVTNPVVMAKHGLLGMDYYLKAIGKMKELNNDRLQFFIFSDDPFWCREAFGLLPNATIVEDENLPHWYDMYLMTLCRHHIIANSSYSWWSAWLASHPEQIVIAPSQWQTNVHPGAWKLCPENWELV